MAKKSRATKASEKPSGTHSEATMPRDLDIARRRVGRTPEQQAQWLVGFLKDDPHELSTVEHIAREQQAAMFVSAVMDTPAATLSQARLSLGTGATFGDEHLREIWLEVGDLMKRWAAGETVVIPSTETQVRLRTGTGKDLRAQLVRVGEGREAFLVSVFDVLAHPKVRIRKCEECRQFFIPTRRQERHPDCARAYHHREWNKKRKGQTEENTATKEEKA